MTCTAIITEDGIDQIIENDTSGHPRLVAKALKELRAMDIGKVKAIVFENEEAAYAWQDQRTSPYL